MVAQTPDTQTTAPSTGVKKLNLGGIGKAKKSTKTVYPRLPDPTGDAAKLAADVIDEQAQFDSLEGSLKAKKAELRRLAANYYFPLFSGKGEIPSSIAVHDADGREVLVNFQNRYGVMEDESTLAALLGPERTGRFLTEKTTLKLKLSDLPEGVDQEKLIAALLEVFEQHNATQGVTSEQGVTTTKDFHTLRHTQLTPEENDAFDKLLPIVVQVKTKGRGE